MTQHEYRIFFNENLFSFSQKVNSLYVFCQNVVKLVHFSYIYTASLTVLHPSFSSYVYILSTTLTFQPLNLIPVDSGALAKNTFW